MKLSTVFIASLSFIPSLIAAAAIPDIATDIETLVKRGGEVNYLSNCIRLDFKGPWPMNSYTASYIAWYANVDNTQSGHDVRQLVFVPTRSPTSIGTGLQTASLTYPGDQKSLSLANLSSLNSVGDYLHWEGQQQNIYFSDSAASLQTHINGDAQSLGFQAYAGSAQRTSDGKKFTCYKDNGRQLFDQSTTDSDGNTHGNICHSIYYCV
ncbi:hypothetical protein M407DRAFT_28088 [Tulasnella calospora MUT 4182]|uniref:Uncharacterized protein n=1 Tax=Tulasnella calospora MUT 4182 TaxID=1051891 RepID=A0A0C3Q210_9AGAM|nr:hypothetical protein M407DRAFT_28088 [Tulasnella calospora MUT 4182]